MDLTSKSRGAIAALAVTAMAALAACERHHDVTPAPAGASPSGVLIGTTPANPTGDPPGTTPVSANTGTVSKYEDSMKRPKEGDDSSHSTEAKVTPQKADGVNHTASTPGRR